MSIRRVVRPLLALVLASLAGCTASPVGAPRLTVENPEFVRAQTVPQDDGVGPTASESGSDGPTASRVIDGRKGGVVDVGAFRVQVPPGAFEGSATITLEQPDPAVLRCALSIAPESANFFKVPVLLIARPPDRNAIGKVMVWYDPSAATWRRIASLPSADVQEVIAPLTHFSDYGLILGRAGW